MVLSDSLETQKVWDDKKNFDQKIARVINKHKKVFLVIKIYKAFV